MSLSVPHVLLLRHKSSVLASIAFIHTPIIIHVDLYLLPSNFHRGGRKDGRGNEPVGSCATCDARSTGPTAHERVEAKLYNTYKGSLLRMNGETFFVAV